MSPAHQMESSRDTLREKRRGGVASQPPTHLAALMVAHGELVEADRQLYIAPCRRRHIAGPGGRGASGGQTLVFPRAARPCKGVRRATYSAFPLTSMSSMAAISRPLELTLSISRLPTYLMLRAKCT